MISTKNIVKDYGTVRALDDISLDIRKGEIFGIIGPDGAGKSTLFGILTTLIIPTSGTAQVAGYDVVNDYIKIRSMIGYMPGKFSLYLDMSVEENIQFFAKLFGSSFKKNYHLVKDIYSHLEPFRKRKAAALSGGMKQKLALSCALIHSPKVLFLDEPTTGVDPVSRKEFWEMLKKLRDGGLTIAVSTPYMDEAALCDRIALINEGKFMDIDSPSNIVAKFNRCLLSVAADDIPKALQELRNLEFVEGCFAFGNRLHLTILGLNKDIREENLLNICNALTQELNNKGCTNVVIEKIEPNIEDCYIHLQNNANTPEYESCSNR